METPCQSPIPQTIEELRKEDQSVADLLEDFQNRFGQKIVINDNNISLSIDLGVPYGGNKTIVTVSRNDVQKLQVKIIGPSIKYGLDNHPNVNAQEIIKYY